MVADLGPRQGLIVHDADSFLTEAGALTLTRNASNGLLTGTTLGVATDSRMYSTFGELSTYTANVSGSPVLNVTYARDKLGRIRQKLETLGGIMTTYTYDYDLTGRLIQVQQNGATTASYTYDSNGNRLTGPDLSSAPIYDDQDRLLLYGPNSYTYTANGELATKTVGSTITTYTYDELGNLTRVVLPGGTQLDYLIDGENRRIGKKVNGTLTQGYLYDGILRLVAELDGAGNLVSRFVYGSRSNVPDSMIKGGVTYRIISDHLGSPRLIVDVATGTAAQQVDYDEFGNVLTDSNPGFQPFDFAGGLYDPDTGLVRFGARDYDAETGRWTTKDQIRFDGGDVNMYGYVGNNPINFIDPWGLIKLKPGVSDSQLKDVLKNKYDVIDKVFKDNNAPEPIITSTNYSTKHKRRSKHYENEAIDLRGNNVTDAQMRKLAGDLAKQLGNDYDVIPEFFPKDPLSDHIHIEYDPKKKFCKRP